tara:strand:- start:11017 stop:12171 length:1155 start_codon:yes stop_codon:yes gene_type:complete
MKYSVLLPTREGGRYLANAVRSILSDPYEDMELVVSDNANTDETPEILASFAGDPRLKVVRTKELIPVHDNWNLTVKESSGDYILMLGDDDYLPPGYFTKMDKLLEQYDYPDCITYNYCVFVFPNALDNEVSYYSNDAFKFGRKFPASGGVLSPKVRFSILMDMFHFKAPFPLLMPPTLIARKAIKRILGEMFQPPYPDYYALSSLLMLAESWVYHPESLVIVGVTPHSHGSYQYSSEHEMEVKGLEYLGINKESRAEEPGSPTINQVNIWLEKMKSNYGDRLDGIEMDRPNYLLRLVFYWYLEYRRGTLSLISLLKRTRELSVGDWLSMFFVGLSSATVWERFWREIKCMGCHRIQKIWIGALPLSPDITDVKKFALWLGESR